MPILKKYHDHRLFQVNARSADEDDDTDIEFKSVINGVKRRKEQRSQMKKEEKKRKEKKKANQMLSEDKRFAMQAASANRQIAVAESKAKIDFLRLMQESKVYTPVELKKELDAAKESILGTKPSSKNSTPETEYCSGSETDSE